MLIVLFTVRKPHIFSKGCCNFHAAYAVYFFYNPLNWQNTVFVYHLIQVRRDTFNSLNSASQQFRGFLRRLIICLCVNAIPQT